MTSVMYGVVLGVNTWKGEQQRSAQEIHFTPNFPHTLGIYLRLTCPSPQFFFYCLVCTYNICACTCRASKEFFNIEFTPILHPASHSMSYLPCTGNGPDLTHLSCAIGHLEWMWPILKRQKLNRSKLLVPSLWINCVPTCNSHNLHCSKGSLHLPVLISDNQQCFSLKWPQS